MYSKVNYTIVGIFVLSFTIASLFFIFWLSNKGFKDEFKYYKTYIYESVGGLSIDSNVKLKGINVGSIDEIYIDSQDIERVILTLKIKQNTPIKEDMLTIIKPLGITGLSYIEIIGGSNSASELTTSDNNISVIKNIPSMMLSFEDNINILYSKVLKFLDKSDKLLSDTNLDSIKSILLDSKIVAQKTILLEDTLIKTLLDINKTLINFDSSSQELVKTFKPTIKELYLLLRDIKKTVRRGDYNFKNIIEPIKIDINEVSFSLQELIYNIDNISRNPRDIIFKSNIPKRQKP
jgi:phospholipid/cholesterol/gamma-HCH transport system substrate-binding protein